MKSVPQALLAAMLVGAVSCAAPSTPAQQNPGPDGGTTGGVIGLSSAAEVAQALGRTPHFLIGLGNDLRGAPDYDHNKDGAYTLGTAIDLHYAYLVGLQGMGGWPDWNAGGTFVNILADAAKAHGVTPMFTLYSMAASGEGNLSVLTDDQYMKAYWDGAKLLYQRIAASGAPALVHFEPDFWAFTQQAQGDPTKLAVHVKANAPDCASLPDDMTGMGKCLVRLARLYAPKAVVGFHASGWAAGNPGDVALYLVKIGAGDGDLIVIETLDRDAGCFEAHTDAACQRGSASDHWYWDETNQTSPNFHEHLSWAKAIADGTGKPLLWWQMPLGVPGAVRGGTAGHYRDNRAHYLFNHTSEFVAAGGVGAAFGVGAGNQTDITTDGNQFKDAVAVYFGHPAPLP